MFASRKEERETARPEFLAIFTPKRDEERKREREEKKEDSNHTAPIEIHLKPFFSLFLPSNASNSFVYVLRVHRHTRYSRHDQSVHSRRIRSRLHAQSVIAFYCALRRLKLESD